MPTSNGQNKRNARQKNKSAVDCPNASAGALYGTLLGRRTLTSTAPPRTLCGTCLPSRWLATTRPRVPSPPLLWLPRPVITRSSPTLSAPRVNPSSSDASLHQ